MKRGIKLTALATLVALALTGFTTGRGHGGRGGHKSSGSGGGGCSSSSQNHGGSSNANSNSSSSGGSSRYDDSDSYGNSGSSGTSGSSGRTPRHRSTPSSSASGGGSSLRDATVKLVKCASVSAPYATVEVSNPNRSTQTFQISVDFQDADGIRVTSDVDQVKVKGKGTARARLKVDGEGLVGEIDRCDVDPVGYVKR
ncbi:hypothetical protein V2W30_17395 [Streptomyces sp. Q6]|uniref:Uncharacterized protein n=1 Tax=Streptomyces citrinus TaxID=3118173 RepID=A0ACD5ACI7_9ACTN